MENTFKFKVFLSHAEEDRQLVYRIWSILDRIKADPYMHELYPDYRQDIPTGIRDVLRDCVMCVSFLTAQGINSQWVQQELGVAYAFDKIIVPVLEVGLGYKGFVQMRRRITYQPANHDDMISSVIYAIRTHVIGHDAVPSGIALACAHGHRHDYTLPSGSEINHAIDAKNIFGVKCQTCKEEIKFSPITLEEIRDKGIPLWSSWR
jgi:hypothetical protein